MTPPDARRDLVDSLLQSCWVLEEARARVLAEWDGEFASDAERTRERADRARRLLTDRGIDVPEHIVEPHTDWVRVLCGSRPDEVPLGAAVLQRFGHWTDVYVKPYLGADAARFEELGHGELRFPTPARDITREEVYLPSTDLPDGRRFVVFTDTHVGAQGILDLARSAVQDINRLGPEFVVCPGDLTDDGEPAQFERFREVVEGIEAPTYAVLGNHDAVRRSTRDPVGAELFAEVFGEKPVDRVLECGELQVALVDSTDPTPSPFPDWDLARGGFRDDAGGVNNGALAPGQAEALASKLDPDRPALVVLHHELQPFAGFPPVMFGMRQEDSDTLLEALRGHRIVGFVAGHTHRSFLTEAEGDGTRVPVLEIPALKDWPYCYTVVSVDGNGVRISVRQLSDAELVWSRAQRVPPIYVNYVLGPGQALEHTFEL